jgi:hypothetical protein
VDNDPCFAEKLTLRRLSGSFELSAAELAQLLGTPSGRGAKLRALARRADVLEDTLRLQSRSTRRGCRGKLASQRGPVCQAAETSAREQSGRC